MADDKPLASHAPIGPMTEKVYDHKVEVISSGDNSSATIVLNDEDHTLGNATRYVLAKNPQVDFVGYSVPHPSERKVHLRLQTKSSKDAPGKSAVATLKEGLQTLTALCDYIDETYDKALAEFKANQMNVEDDDEDDEDEAE